MSDLIDRQAAIDKMQMFIDRMDKEATAYKSLMVAFNRCIIELKRIPSAQPQRKKGKWEPLYDNIWICTNCEQTEQFGVNIESTSDYCPSCGARMDSESDD